MRGIWQASIQAIEGYYKKLQWVVIGCAVLAVIFCGLGKVSGKRAMVLAQQQFLFSKKNMAAEAVSSANIQKKMSDLNNQLANVNIALQTEKENVGKAVKRIKSLKKEIIELKSKSSPKEIVIAQPMPDETQIEQKKIEQENSPLVKKISKKENNLEEKAPKENGSNGYSDTKSPGDNSDTSDLE